MTTYDRDGLALRAFASCLVLVALGLWSACNCSARPEDMPCTFDTDCPEGYRCDGTRCAAKASDGGTADDAGAGGDAGAGEDAGGVDAGTSCGTVGSIRIDDFCANAQIGLQRMLLASATSCGQPLTPADVPHLEFASGVVSISGQMILAAGSCVDGGTLSIYAGNLADSIRGSRVCFDGQFADRCRDAMRGLLDAGPSLGDAGQLFADGGPYAGCFRLFKAMVQDGGACQRDYECVDGTFCGPASSASCAGACRVYLSVGERCSRNMVCGTGLKCNKVDGGAVCQVDPAASDGGRGCSSSVDCDTDEDCVGTGSNKSCVEKAGFGLPCSTNLQTLPGCQACLYCSAGTCAQQGGVNGACSAARPCANWLSCDVGTGLCKVAPRVNEACAVPSGSPTGLKGDCMWVDNFCKRLSPSDLTGACAALPGAGEQCGAAPDLWPTCAAADEFCAGSPRGVCAKKLGAGSPCTGNVCASGLYCATVDGGARVCAALPTTGQRCTTSGTCADGYWCASGTCQPKKANGGGCMADAECVSGNCENGVCSAACQPGISAGASGYSCSGCEGCKQGLDLVSMLLVFSIVATWRGGRRRREN